MGGNVDAVLAWLALQPTYRPPMRKVVGEPRRVKGGAWERLECGHELFVTGSHKPGTRGRRHCEACFKAGPG